MRGNTDYRGPRSVSCELHSVRFTQRTSLGVTLSPSPHYTTRGALRKTSQSKQRLHLYHCAAMAESDPYFKKFLECEEL